MNRWMSTSKLAAVLVFVAVVVACFQPTAPLEDAGGADGDDVDGGGGDDTPPAPPVDDYTALFQIAEDGVYVLPGTDGTDDAAIGDGSVSVGDVDNDGDPDVVMAGEYFSAGRLTAVYLNDGTGVFADAGASLATVGADAATALGDVNGDGTLDLFISGDTGSGNVAALYTNEVVGGAPVFTEDSSAAFPALIQGQARFFDPDDDDDLDLLITGLENRSDYRAYLYVNQGPADEGTFELSDNGGTPSLADTVQRGSVGIADFDGQDGPDIVLTGTGAGGRGTTLVLNDGNGVFAPTPSRMEGLGLWSSTSVADIDGGGSPDVFITGYNAPGDVRARLYSNNGSGDFTDVTSTQASDVIGVQESASVLGDIDLDGDPDLLVIGREAIGSAGFPRMYLNDGAGSFGLEDDGPSIYGTLKGTIDLLDVDGDTDLDLLVTGLRGSTPSAILHINTLFD